MRKYRNKPIAELAVELGSGLARLRRGYLDHAEELLRLIEPSQEYPYEFVVHRLTGYRPGGSAGPGMLLEGRSLQHDLLQLILDVSESFDLHTSDHDEVVYDTPALSQRFNVSTKTVQRWRNRGLPARRVIFPDGRRRVGFLDSSVRWFLEGHQKEIQRSIRFSQLTEAEKQDILQKSRHMIETTQCSLSDVARRLARQTGRAVETIRYTIRKHDNDHPDRALFPHLLNTLDNQEKRRIYRSFLRGEPVPSLSERYHRTRGSIYRIVNEMRAVQLLERPISYVFNEEFERPDADELILVDPEPDVEGRYEPIEKAKAPRDLPPYLRSLYEVPLLSAESEFKEFRRYNYFKYKADQLRKKIDVNRISVQQIKDVEALLLQANVAKNRIVRANLRLVVSIAKKHVSGPLNLFELISDGNVSLMRAVEKFDYARGFRFSTYASWAIMRNFARSVPKERYQLDRFSTGHEEVLDIAAGLRSYDPEEENLAELRESITVMLDHLSARERTILVNHYGLDENATPKTFDQLGRQLGISKERVRQIEIQALDKLRAIGNPEE
ncbi:MAG: sigma-70 family RNA polymerase sigma factor [Phycisphaerae bacterium]|nr:sigma-70 family RNA polymerase sigma factor [Phycisphaerae bacterium]